jgi:hypothetical protein
LPCAGHLVISAAVVALAALLVFGGWYPSPWRQLLGVAGVFGLVVSVDLVCGPLLTLEVNWGQIPIKSLYEIRPFTALLCTALGHRASGS